MATFGTCEWKRLGDGVYFFYQGDTQKAWIEITIGNKVITRKANYNKIRRIDGLQKETKRSA